MKSTLSFLLSTLLFPVLFTACSKDDGNGGTPTPDPLKGKNMKLTITATGLTASDHLNTTVTGGTINGTEKTLYKMNGIVLDNQKGFEIDQSKLIAGPVIIETVVPVAITSVSMGGFSTAGHTFSIKIEPVIDGKAQTTIKQVYNSDALAKRYDFQ